MVPWYAQNGGSVSASKAGLAPVALMLGTAVAAPLGGRLADQFGTRATAGLGAVVFVVGLFLLVPTDPGMSLVGLAWRLAVAGFGVGLNLGPSQTAVLTATGPASAVTAGSVVQLARNVGVALGPATAVATASACLAVFLLVAVRPLALMARGRRIATAAPVNGRHRRVPAHRVFEAKPNASRRQASVAAFPVVVVFRQRVTAG
jgi:MFS family permease